MTAMKLTGTDGQADKRTGRKTGPRIESGWRSDYKKRKLAHNLYIDASL